MKVRQIIMVILLSHIWNHIYPTLNNILEIQRFFFFFLFFPQRDKYLIITNETLTDSEKGLYHP